MTALADRVRRIPSWQVTLGFALFTLGFLVTAQLRSEAPRVRYTSQERPPLIETALGLQDQQEQLKDRILALRGQIQDLEARTQGNAALVRQLNSDLDAARSAAGLVALQGSGVVFQLQDSSDQVQPGTNDADYLVGASDVRVLVQELWLAGAEAIAVNGERVTGSSAILDIGGSVLVNSAYLAPPYQVSAIGPADLYDQLSQAQGFRDFVRARAEAFGIKISYAVLADVSVPAYAGTINQRYARPEASARPTTAPTSGPTATGVPAAATPAATSAPGSTAAPSASRASARPTVRATPRPTTRPRAPTASIGPTGSP
jgi:uncharacterized protein YlxW (UPF0749 family)